MSLAMVSLMLVGLPKAFANSPNGDTPFSSDAQLSTDTPKHNDKPSKQCSMDGFCGADEKKTTKIPAA
jgi:hypothetical protein